MTNKLSHKLARACVLPVTVGLSLLTAAPALAHVSISPSEAEAGAYAVLTVSVPHGCDGSPTTTVAIQVPEPILAVTPTRNPLWRVEKVMEKLQEPVTDSHGTKVTERVGQVVYSARTPLPEGYRDAFQLSLRMPETAGETLVFPVVQSCKRGETAWIETAEAGGDAHELEAPAPTVTLVEAQGDEHSAMEAKPTTTTTEDGNTLGVLGLGAGLLGLAAGGLALVQVRRRS
jgi:uncharacterized protein YcnI